MQRKTNPALAAPAQGAAAEQSLRPNQPRAERNDQSKTFRARQSEQTRKRPSIADKSQIVE
jgi:hypothetical protein